MKLKLIFAVLGSAAPIAVAQVTPPQSKPVYFLVDASGSMDGQNKKDAERYLNILAPPRGQAVSITYFGKKPGTPSANLCFEKLKVEDPRPREYQFSPQLTDLGGIDDQTAITNAIDEMLSHLEGKGPAKLIVVTDGQEGCNPHFSEIWHRHPTTKIQIEVRQVGNSPNGELQRLEEGPPTEPMSKPAAPLINLELLADLTPPSSNAWDTANWLARYFWLVPYLLLASAAAYFSSSFGNAARRYEYEINKLQDHRRRADEHLTKTGERLNEPWPVFISDAAAAQEGHNARRNSLALFLLSCTAGIPLVLLSGATWDWARLVVPLLAPIALLWLLFISPLVTPRHWVVTTLASSTRWKIALAVSASALCVTYYLMDDELARSAAWMVLSSGFSAALAIVASAPLLFAGRQLAELDRAKSSYKTTWDHGLDEKHRQEMAEAQRRQEDRDRFLTRVAEWIFPPFTNPFARIPDFALRRNMKVVKTYLEGLAAEFAKRNEVGSKLNELSQTGDLLRLIRAIVEIPELNLSDQTKNALKEIVVAYDSGFEKKIKLAFAAAAKTMPS